ncbi:MAG: glycine cleavage system protein T, partial [Actinomycetia bacterium]|nr:glycine cleavage system protein T [Actinomycetes bacterium]
MQTINENNKLRRTPLYQKHLELGAKMIDFGGWIMPLNYPEGIIAEHLTTRKEAGLFDVSHMGRFTISRKDTLSFLQHVLTNNAAALKVGESQYTIISDEDGIAIDDAYLYRFYQEQYLLVVNASNQDKDKEYLMSMSSSFKDVKINDITNDLSMLSLQGPRSEEILISLISLGALPKPTRNKSSIIKIGDIKVLVARTGYTGEPIGFELFTENKRLADLWTLLCTRGSSPVGLGARDTLRLEAGLPLYRNEL